MSFPIKQAGAFFFLCILTFLLFGIKSLAFDAKASDALSQYIMALMQDDLGDLDQAIEGYKKALMVDPENPVIHLSLAEAYIKKNELTKAIDELKITAKLDQGSVEAHAILALLYSLENKTDLATQEYEIALKNASRIQPKNIDIYKSLGLIYIQQKKLEDAAKAYRMIIELTPKDEEAHFLLASIYNEMGNNDLAEEELRLALELNADYDEALNFLGYLWVEEDKNLEKAEAMIRKALEIDPDNAAYIDSLGWFYYKKGKYNEAVEQLEKATKSLQDAVIFDHLGDAYFKLNSLDEARKNWQKSLELNPDQEKIKEKIEKLNG